MEMKSKAILLIVIACILSANVIAYATPYDDSAHGNTTYGPLWTTGDIYTQGHCGQCHTQHFSEMGAAPPYNFALFYDDYIAVGDMFCFQCHRTTDLGYGQVTNYPYCVNFGGRSAYYAAIKKQFTNANSKPAACGSRHHLTCIRNFIKNNENNWGFSSDPNPCVACHPPHAAQRNHPVAIEEGKLNTAIRRPSDYKSTNSADLLWGDDANERMSSYASSIGGTYQAPYYADTTSGRYEPDGSTSEPVGGWGSNTPDYVTFCMDCHQYAQYDTERNAAVKAIDWSADRHGGYPANDCDTWEGYEGTLRPPYDTYEPNESNYVLSCLDCHEPHGTHKRLHLIRRMINGENVDADNPSCNQNADWVVLCERCHNVPHPGWGSCNVDSCHGDDTNKFHGGTWPNTGPLGPFGTCITTPSF